MQTGQVEANLLRLNEFARVPYIDELVSRKLAGPECSKLDETGINFHRREYERLRGVLQTAYDVSTLPEGPSARPGLDDLLVRLRMRA